MAGFLYEWEDGGVIYQGEIRRMLGWNLVRCRLGYLRAYRKKDGRLICLYLGKCQDTLGDSWKKMRAANLRHGLLPVPPLN
ncbi:MAG: hypothetical protein H7838_11130 [Magnetococcus sp. DMHC-8]